jgi:formiminoglutamase
MSSPAAKYPILVSLPHGGLAVPPEVADRLAITATHIYNECDLWVNDLFAEVAARAQASVTAPIARVLVDVNRVPDDMQNPDGAIKITTSYGQPIYRTPLSPAERQHLLVKYYWPFHHALRAAMAEVGDRTRLLLDCHNMAQHGPAAYADPGAQRPFICLANFGDARGEQRLGGALITCDPALLRAAAANATEIFGDLALLEPDPTSPPVVAINQPFAGGHVLSDATPRLAERSPYPVQGIMVEVNRGLFVGRQSPDTPIAPPNVARIEQIRDRLARWVDGLVTWLPAGETDTQ